MDTEIISLREGEEYIKLSQAMKKASLVGSGAESKMRIRLGGIRVNDEEEDRPGRKLYSGDVITFDGKKYRIE